LALSSASGRKRQPSLFSTAISSTTETSVLAATMAKMVSELAAFENHVGMQAGPSSGRQVCFRESSGLP
jgi:hypothetical protein